MLQNGVDGFTHCLLLELLNCNFVDDLHAVEPLVEGRSVSYPGEGMIKTREENLAKGVPVDKDQWENLQTL